MRIVAGRFGGRRIVAPRGAKTRPTADMVREALFSALFDVEGWRVLDLYAGTGAVGLEALSRGATRVIAVERARPALAALRDNARSVSAAPPAFEVRAGAVSSALVQLAAAEERFDLIFADPPYDQAARALPEVLAAAQGLLTDDGIVVVEHRGTEPAPAAPDGLIRTKTRRYGEAALAYYRAEGA